MKKALSIVASVTVAMSIITGAAYAEPRDGGEWYHGDSGGRVWSHYWHPNFNHGTSVNGYRWVDSGCKGPGLWARAEAPSRWFGASGAYYRFC